MGIWELLAVAAGILFVEFIIVRLLIRHTKDIYYGVKSKKWPSVNGSIVSSNVGIERDPSDWDNVRSIAAYQVKYQYTIGGEKFTNNVINFDSTKYNKSFYPHRQEPPILLEEVQQLFPASSKTRVYYHPTKPNLSVLKPGYSLHPVTLFILVFMTIIFCVFIFLFYKIFSTQPPTTQPPITQISSPTPTFFVRGISPKDGMQMILIPKGTFTMGGGTENDERFKHDVFIDAFWIDQTEVTIDMYTKCVESGVCTPPQGNNFISREHYFNDPSFSDYPVIQIDWFQADIYCKWAGRRLPTEAEWEKAARGFGENIFPWGEVQDCRFANYWGEDGKCVGDVVAVGSYPEGISPFSVFDMAGNAYEWVADWYDSEYYMLSPVENPQGPETGTTRVLRGGSFLHLPQMMYTFSRKDLDPSYADVFTGFRCSQSP